MARCVVTMATLRRAVRGYLNTDDDAASKAVLQVAQYGRMPHRFRSSLPADGVYQRVQGAGRPCTSTVRPGTSLLPEPFGL